MTIPVPVVLVITISVSGSNVPSPMIDRAIAEADAIWRTAGVVVERYRSGAPAAAVLNVEFVDDAGRAPDAEVPLAWIDVVDNRPIGHIYVSRLNAVKLVGTTTYLPRDVDMVPAAVNEVIGRALGRALAHEIGHYVFGSRAHDPAGVMATRRPPSELFSRDRTSFLPTRLERRRLEGVVLDQRKLASAPPTVNPPASLSCEATAAGPFGAGRDATRACESV